MQLSAVEQPYIQLQPRLLSIRQTVGGTVSGGAAICTGSPSGQLTLSGQTGTVVKWQSSVDSGATWADIVNTATTYTSGALTQTTQFRAVVQSGACAAANSAATTVSVDPVSVGGVLTAGVTQVYLGQSTGNITLAGQTGNVVKWQERLNGGAWLDVAKYSPQPIQILKQQPAHGITVRSFKVAAVQRQIPLW